MNKLCLTVLALNLNKFLFIDFNKKTLQKNEVFLTVCSYHVMYAFQR